jgi:hypothetical protein
MPSKLVRAIAAAGVAATLALALGGCNPPHGPPTGQPVEGALPTADPSVTPSEGSCIGDRPSAGQHRHGLVGVRSDPTSVTAYWWPGYHDEACLSVHTTHGKAVAHRLAADVLHAPRYPKGARNCPLDEGSLVELWFGGPDGSRQRVDVVATGCRKVFAPGRTARTLTSRLAADLARVAPQPWADQLRSNQ